MTTKKAKTKKIKLPNKLSGLLEIAVTDMQKIRRRKGYVLNMSTWHTPDIVAGKPCHVCMAGSVMACTLSVPSSEFAEPGSSTEIDRKLRAINQMRIGNFAIAYSIGTGKTADDELETELYRIGDFVGSQYSENDERAPDRVYRKAVKMLREINL
jgi:hypothetical protein